MFVLFGKKSKYRPVSGGRLEKRRCPDCEKTAVFVECEETSKYHVFYVEVLSDEDRVFVCSECGEAMDLEDTEAPALSAREQEALAKRELAERERVARERQQQKQAMEKSVDSELAALKKRLAKE